MRTVIYSDVVKSKLKSLKDRLIVIQGVKKGTKTISSMVSILDNLGEFADTGISIREKFDVDCPSNWYLLYCNRNYFIYSKSDKQINILEMYDNRQDFMNELFGIEMRSFESISFWGE